VFQDRDLFQRCLALQFAPPVDAAEQRALEDWLCAQGRALIEGLPGFAHMWSFSNEADERPLVTTFTFFSSPVAARRAADSPAWREFLQEIGDMGCEGIQMSLLCPPAVSSSARRGQLEALAV
jgi:hypothetical protein